MNKRWWLNLLMALLVGVLVLLAVFGPDAKKSPPLPPLTQRQPDSIHLIRLARPGHTDIVLRKNGDDWVMNEPDRTRANEFRINDFLSIATTPVSAHFPAQPDQLDQFGLRHPSAILYLDSEEIRLGSMHPIQNQIYVLHDDLVSLVGASTLRASSVRLEDLYSLRPLGAKLNIVAMQFPDFNVTKTGSGAWQRTPVVKDLSTDTVNRFIDEWQNAIAMSVSRRPANNAGQRIRVSIVAGAQRQQIDFYIAQRRPELILVRADERLAYRFPAEAGERLLHLNQDPSVPAYDSQTHSNR